jgi:SAM-dependent methyltransferase
MTPDPLHDYYARRAPEYEDVYRRPGRDADLADLEARLVAFAEGRDVLELACGTGYWTERIARTARTVTAVDVVPEVLERAMKKEYPPARVRFRLGDAFRLDDVSGSFDAVLAAFLWSHLPRRQIATFLDGIQRRFPDGVAVAFVDNRFVEASNTPISRRDDRGDTWQTRTLADGSIHEIRKNFPGPDELAAQTRLHLVDVDIALPGHFWCLTGRTLPLPPEEHSKDDTSA